MINESYSLHSIQKIWMFQKNLYLWRLKFKFNYYEKKHFNGICPYGSCAYIL